MTESINLNPGAFAEVVNDWRVFVVKACVQHSGVVYVGSYPYSSQGQPLHPDAPLISQSWDGKTAGARQISERQKRFDVLIPALPVEPLLDRLHA